MNNVWFPPPQNVVKINVHGVIDEIPWANGNTNGVGIIVRDHNSRFLWGIMAPMHGLEGFQSQIWAIHLAMKITFQRQIPHVHIQSDNMIAFDMFVDQDEEELEEEGLTVVVQQINILFTEYNKPRQNLASQKSCKVYSVFTTRNRAPSYMAEFAFRNCSGLVEVPTPFGDLYEILDLDHGLGPNLPAFDIQIWTG
ncbi:hypothetical protein POM88_006911 [Heracleum sosnowskyi]|uniref:RNase H type-1 domain-containing protein n=1 Tax=Heracleum sosnowskyi TaxID=360622 RepID=A0AAD8J5R4_9APIA|nr:hypothetical protein POM88_006911 [Heracleum sosnowskyi]